MVMMGEHKCGIAIQATATEREREREGLVDNLDKQADTLTHAHGQTDRRTDGRRARIHSHRT